MRPRAPPRAPRSPRAARARPPRRPPPHPRGPPAPPAPRSAARGLEEEREGRRRAKERDKALRSNKPGGIPLARVRRPAPVPVASRPDSWARLGQLLRAAEEAPDSRSRILRVAELLLVLLSDLASPPPDPSPALLPLASLGSHLVTRRDVGGATLAVNALALRAPRGATSLAAHGAERYAPNAPPAPLMATAEVTLCPEASLGPGGGGGAALEVALGGGFRVAFPGHAEVYECPGLPSLTLSPVPGAPSWGRCAVALSGSLRLTCAARGTRVRLAFEGGDSRVSGALEALGADSGYEAAGTLAGSLGAGVVCLLGGGRRRGRGARGRGGAGAAAPVAEAVRVLSPGGSPPPVDLGRIGPRAFPQAWVAVVDALERLCWGPPGDGGPGARRASARGGRGGGGAGEPGGFLQLLRDHLDPLRAGDPGGSAPPAGRGGGPPGADTDSDSDSDGDGDGPPRPGRVPPCVWEERRAGLTSRVEVELGLYDGGTDLWCPP